MFTIIEKKQTKKKQAVLNFKLKLKAQTDLLNIFIQLLIWVNLSHQVLQLLLTEHLEQEGDKFILSVTKAFKGADVVCSLKQGSD